MEEIARHDVLTGLEQAREALALVRAGTQRGYGLSDGECRDAVEAAVQVGRGGAGGRGRVGEGARRPGGRGPRGGGRERRRLPRALKTRTVTDEATGEQVTGMQAVDRVLARTVRDQPVRGVRHLVDRLVTLLGPGRRERFDEDAHLRRGVHLSVESTGMGVLHATLTPADTAVLKALLAQWGRPNPATTCLVQDEDGSVQEALVRDERPLSVRRYDGFMAATPSPGC